MYYLLIPGVYSGDYEIVKYETLETIGEAAKLRPEALILDAEDIKKFLSGGEVNIPAI